MPLAALILAVGCAAVGADAESGLGRLPFAAPLPGPASDSSKPVLGVEMGAVAGANATGSWELFDLDARHDAALAVLPRGDVVAVGGLPNVEGVTAPLRSVLASKNGGITWGVASASSAMPPRMGTFPYALSNGSVVVASGLGQSSTFHDVWRSDDAGATWAQVTDQPPWPARSHGGAVRLPGDELILAGGAVDVESGMLNDVWASGDGGATWEQRSKRAAWSKRSRFGMAAARCSASGGTAARIILAGGWTEEQPVGISDVWFSDDAGATWQQATGSAAWQARSRFAMAAMPGASHDTVVLAGGETAYSLQGAAADVWAASACTPGVWWNVTLNAPWLPRRGLTGAFLLDGTMLLFGGQPVEGSDLGQNARLAPVWRSRDGGRAWNTAYQPDPWSPRGGARMVTTLSGATLLVGGVVAGKGIHRHVSGADDSWTSRNVGLEWHRAYRSGHRWSPRAWPAVAVHPEGLVLLLGGSVTAEEGPFFDDVWASADEGGTWRLRNASAGWRPRSKAAALVLPSGRALLMGGWAEGHVFCGDVWASDDAGFSWHPLPVPSGHLPLCSSAFGRWGSGRSTMEVAMLPATPTPPASSRSAEDLAVRAAPESCGVTLVLAGGSGPGMDSLNDVWWSQDCGGGWARVVEHAEWEPRSSFGLLPLPRLNATTLLLFGGQSGTGIYPFNDVWRSGDAGVSWHRILESAPWSHRSDMAYSLVLGGSPMLAGGFLHNSGKEAVGDVWFGTADGSMWRRADVGVRSWSDANAAAITPGLVAFASGRDAVSKQPQTSFQVVSASSATPLGGWQGPARALGQDEPVLFQRAAARVPVAAIEFVSTVATGTVRYVDGGAAYVLLLLGGADYGSLKPRAIVHAIVPRCRRQGCASGSGGSPRENEVHGYRLRVGHRGAWAPRRAAMAAAATFFTAVRPAPRPVSVLLMVGGRDAEGRALSDLWASTNGGVNWQPVAGPGPAFPHPAPWAPISRGVLLAVPSCGAFCFTLATGEDSSGRLRRTVWRLRLAPAPHGDAPTNATAPPWTIVRLAATQLVYNASTLPFLPRHSASPVTLPGGSGGCFVGGQEATGARVGDVWCTWDGARWWKAGPSPPPPPSPTSYGAGTTAVHVPSIQGAMLLGGAQRSLLAHVPSWSVAEPGVGEVLVRGAFHALRWRTAPSGIAPDLAVRLRCVVVRDTEGPGLRGWVPGPTVVATADADANGWSGGATLPAGAAPPDLAPCASQHAMWSLETPGGDGATGEWGTPTVQAASAPLPLSDNVEVTLELGESWHLVAGSTATLHIRRSAGVMEAVDVWLASAGALEGPSWRHVRTAKLLASRVPLPAPGAEPQTLVLPVPPDAPSGLYKVRVAPVWGHDMPGPLPAFDSAASYVDCPPGYAPHGSFSWAALQPCRPCPLGTRSTGAECTPCPAGSRGIKVNETASCIPCPVGTYRPSSVGNDPGVHAATMCDPCPVGMYGVRSGGASEQEACAPCPAGTIGSTPGAAGVNACALCPTGTYSGRAGESSLTACTSCPRGRTTLEAGAVSARACWCQRGSYGSGVGNASCTGCDDEGPFNCDELNLTRASLPLKPGYWMPAAARGTGQDPAACPHPNACVGGRPGDLCARGHRGVLCEACTVDPPYGRASLVTAVSKRPCQPCTPASRRVEWASAVLGMLIFVAASVVVHVPRATRAVLRSHAHTIGPAVAAVWRTLQLVAVVWEASGVMRPPESPAAASLASWLQLALGDPAAATQWGCVAGRGAGRFVVGAVFASVWLVAAAASACPRVWIAATALHCPRALRATAAAGKLAVDGLFVVALRPSLATLLPSRVPTWQGRPGPAETDWTTLANLPGAIPSDVPPAVTGVSATLVAAAVAFVAGEIVHHARRWWHDRQSSSTSRAGSVNRHTARLRTWAAPRASTSVSHSPLLGTGAHSVATGAGAADKTGAGAKPPFPDTPGGRRLHDTVLVVAAMCTAGLRREASSLVPALLCAWTLAWFAAALQARISVEHSTPAERASSAFVHLALGAATVATAG